MKPPVALDDPTARAQALSPPVLIRLDRSSELMIGRYSHARRQWLLPSGWRMAMAVAEWWNLPAPGTGFETLDFCGSADDSRRD